MAFTIARPPHRHAAGSGTGGVPFFEVCVCKSVCQNNLKVLKLDWDRKNYEKTNP
jgi:hypothetical protein